MKFFGFMLQFLWLQMCVYGGSAVPQGGGGGPSLGDRPPGGGWGTVFPGVGKDKGGGVNKNSRVDMLCFRAPAPRYVVFGFRFVGVAAQNSRVEGWLVCILACTPCGALH